MVACDQEGEGNMRRLVVMYGSETGNAQSIAEAFHEDCKGKGYDSTLLAMNDWQKLEAAGMGLDQHKNAPGLAVMVCSTTGNADPPDNCAKFWRFLRKRTHSKTLYDGLHFAMLGLGDSNYDKFCPMGKGIDLRLRELGAKRFYEPGWADEGTGLEDVVEPWLEGVWPALEAAVRELGAVEKPPPVKEEQGAVGQDQEQQAAMVSEKAKAARTSRKRRLVVMYGSETGNAQSIAEGIHEESKGRGIESTLLAMNDWQKLEAAGMGLDQHKNAQEGGLAVMVCSTTGNADPPDNCAKFWRFLRKRTHSKTLYEGLGYCMLGLGDTNYDKFCYMGKSIDTRLMELGGKRFYATGSADEGTGLEDVVEPWLKGLWPALDTAWAEQGKEEQLVIQAKPGSAGAAGDGDGGEESIDKLRQALKGLSAEEQPQEWARLQRLLGNLLLARLEKQVCEQYFDDDESSGTKSKASAARDVYRAGGAEAVKCFSLAQAIMTEEEFPEEHALLLKAKAKAKALAEEGMKQAEALAKDDGDDALALEPCTPAPPPKPSGSILAVGVMGLNLFLRPHTLDPESLLHEEEIPRLRDKKWALQWLPKGAGGGGGGEKGGGKGAGGGAGLGLLNGEAEQEAPANGMKSPRFGWGRGRSMSIESPYTASSPFPATLSAARYLTGGGAKAERRVLHLELALGHSAIRYTPGDAIGIRCPNPAPVVAFMLHRVASLLPQGEGVDSLFTHDASGLPSPVTVRDALTSHLDLCSVPLKRQLRVLAHYTKGDKEQKRRLLLLCSRQAGSKEYSSFVEGQGLTIPELLEMFPACQPPLESLLALLPLQRARFYSVCSSQLALGNHLAIAFSVVKFQLEPPFSEEQQQALGKTHGHVVRHGVCTNWLEGLAAPFIKHRRLSREGLGYPGARGGLESGRSLSPPPVGSGAVAAAAGAGAAGLAVPAPPPGASEIVVPLFLRPTKEFQLPGNSKWPIILIGPGTGVAPFIGFLQHRQALLRREEELQASVCEGVWRGGFELDLQGEADGLGEYKDGEGRGQVWLFFGCRHRSQDWIFEGEMQRFREEGVLDHLQLAFSRDAVQGAQAPGEGGGGGGAGEGGAGAGGADGGDGLWSASNPNPKQLRGGKEADASADKVYVTSLIREAGAELRDLILTQNAYVFVCGDGNRMAQDVHVALRDLLMEPPSDSHSPAVGDTGAGAGSRPAGMSGAEVDLLLKDMKGRGRYVLDVWS